MRSIRAEERMRGEATNQASMLSLIGPERRVPQDHPIRIIKGVADTALSFLSPKLDQMYSKEGRPSIPPERLLKACLLIALYSIRSERQFCEQLDYNLLFRWFLDMSMEDASFNASTFAKNKERLLEADVARCFFEEVLAQAKKAKLMSSDHFTVDGTLIEAWASMKSFRPKGEKPSDKPPPDDPGNPTVDFQGEKRSNETHQSTTDPEARLAKKSKGDKAKLAFSAHVLMENRHGLCADIRLVDATGTAEPEQALAMVQEQRRQGCQPKTLGGDKGYDTADLVDKLRAEGVTPHIAQNITTRRGSNLDDRTTRHEGYAISQRCRKKVEEIFGWMKTAGCFRKTRYRGKRRTGFWAYLVAATYNMVRMSKLMVVEA
jgi:transposase